jgi:hypothetical protein
VAAVVVVAAESVNSEAEEEWDSLIHLERSQ